MSEHPVYTQEEARTRETFLALMWALSYPGKIQALPQGETPNFVLIAETLLDLETSFYTPEASLIAPLAGTGARQLTADRAAYHFYPNADHLDGIASASVGTMLYPDQAATLIIGCQLAGDMRFQLSGPGIDGASSIQIANLPAVFWQQREEAIRYPLGWDVFLVDGWQVLGLPRTAKVIQE